MACDYVVKKTLNAHKNRIWIINLIKHTWRLPLDFCTCAKGALKGAAFVTLVLADRLCGSIALLQIECINWCLIQCYYRYNYAAEMQLELNEPVLGSWGPHEMLHFPKVLQKQCLSGANYLKIAVIKLDWNEFTWQCVIIKAKKEGEPIWLVFRHSSLDPLFFAIKVRFSALTRPLSSLGRDI